MTISEINEIINKTESKGVGSLAKYFHNHKNDLELLKSITKFLPDNSTISERIYYIKNDLYEVKKCKHCNTVLSKPKTTTFCSRKCNINFHIENTDIIERRSINISKNYNNKSYDDKEQIKIKRKNTLLKKYNVINNLHIPNVVEKKKKTWLKNLGVDNPMKADSVKEKTKSTNLRLFGNENPLNSKLGIEKKKKTWLKNLGVDNPMKADSVKEKTKSTYKSNGYIHPMHNEEIVSKIRNTWIKNNNLGKHKKGFKYKIYEFSNGRKIIIQGYEDYILDNYLLKHYNECEISNNIKLMNSFNFEWGETISGIRRKYIPDFYIESENLIIEVKSEYLYNKNISNIFHKAKSVVEKEFDFILLLVNNKKTKIKKITYEEIKIDFKKRNN